MRERAQSYRLWAMIGAIGLIAIGTTLWLARLVAINIISDPGFRFWRHTGLEFPAEARILHEGDSHGGFHGDGEYYLAFEVDAAIIQKWLASRAPWGDWQRGPVPGEIGYHCGFGGSGVSWGGPLNGPQTYSGDEQLVKLFSSDRVWYSARERGDSRLRWHNGNLIVIDVRSRRIWLSVWDF